MIGGLQAAGGTNLSGGLFQGLQLLLRAYRTPEGGGPAASMVMADGALLPMHCQTDAIQLHSAANE
jgi:hypothetical protein